MGVTPFIVDFLQMETICNEHEVCVPLEKLALFVEELYFIYLFYYSNFMQMTFRVEIMNL